MTLSQNVLSIPCIPIPPHSQYRHYITDPDQVKYYLPPAA